jgi:hypothetical protein
LVLEEVVVQTQMESKVQILYLAQLLLLAVVEVVTERPAVTAVLEVVVVLD